jgi:hypothetical protein
MCPARPRPGDAHVGRRRAGCRSNTAGNPVRARCGIPRGDDPGCLLEHRGKVRDRPGRPGRRLRSGELRQQVPRRCRGLHGHRARRDLRRRRGDRRRLSTVRHRIASTGQVPRRTPERSLSGGSDRSRRLRDTHRPPAAAWCKPGDPRRRLCRVPRRTSGGDAEDERHHGRPARCPGGARTSRGRRPRVHHYARRPRAARAGPRRLATRSRAAARSVPPRDAATRARERLATAPRRAQCPHEQGLCR